MRIVYHAVGGAKMAENWTAFLDWFEKHAGLGGWVGAVGALLAIVVTWIIARTEYNRGRQLEKKRVIALMTMIRQAILEYHPIIQKFIELYAADNDEVNDYRGLHAGDPAFARLVDFNRMSVVEWPTVDAYDAFKRYFEISQLLLATPLSDVGKHVMPDRRKEYETASQNVMSALRATRQKQLS